MSEHVVAIHWQARPLADQPQTYSRDHQAAFVPGPELSVSAAVEYKGNPDCADPEQLLVNALASCHMLYFLALCEGSGFKATSYRDRAVGTVAKNEAGAYWVAHIDLSPVVTFAGEKIPGEAALQRLHARAHDGCFIANSLKTSVTITPGQ